MSAAQAAREWFEAQEKTELVLERSSKSKTGFVNVKLIKGKYYQAQLHISKKGREDGGQKPLPRMWKTALEAAQFLALCKKHKGVEPTPAARKRRITPLEGEPQARALPVLTWPHAFPSLAAALADPNIKRGPGIGGSAVACAARTNPSRPALGAMRPNVAPAPVQPPPCMTPVPVALWEDMP